MASLAVYIKPYLPCVPVGHIIFLPCDCFFKLNARPSSMTYVGFYVSYQFLTSIRNQYFLEDCAGIKLSFSMKNLKGCSRVDTGASA